MEKERKAMKPKETRRVFDAAIEVDQQGSKTELRFKWRGRVATKILIAVISILMATGLATLAQVSSFGQLIVENLRRFINF